MKHSVWGRIIYYFSCFVSFLPFECFLNLLMLGFIPSLILVTRWKRCYGNLTLIKLLLLHLGSKIVDTQIVITVSGKRFVFLSWRHSFDEYNLSFSVWMPHKC